MRGRHNFEIPPVIDGMFVYAVILVILKKLKVGKLSLIEACKHLCKPIALTYCKIGSFGLDL